jgi:hypothetical protein
VAAAPLLAETRTTSKQADQPRARDAELRKRMRRKTMSAL